MGLLTGLVTLPLAPVRGTIWLAEQLAEVAARELDDETAIRRQLAEAERELGSGALTIEEYEELEDALLDRLEHARQARRNAEAAV